MSLSSDSQVGVMFDSQGGKRKLVIDGKDAHVCERS